MNLIEDRRFYIYVYLDPRKKGLFTYGKYDFKFEPFYVGKGKDLRLYDHLKESNRNLEVGNKLKINKIIKIKRELNKEPIIIKSFEFLTNEEAIFYEICMIKEIGRINLKTGPLTNLTDGGDGTYGYIPSQKAKENWLKSIHKYYSDETNIDRIRFLSGKEYLIQEYGELKGLKIFNKRIEKIKRSIHQTYKDPKIREKCANRGSKNGSFGITPKSARKVKIDGNIYNSIYEGHIKTKVPYTTLHQRLNSKNFSNYEFI